MRFMHFYQSSSVIMLCLSVCLSVYLYFVYFYVSYINIFSMGVVNKRT